MLFSGILGDENGVYAQELSGGVPVLLKAGIALWTASNDARYFLTVLRSNSGFHSVDTETKQEFPFVSHKSWNLLSPDFSHDAQWVVIHTRNSEITRQIFVLPFHPGRETPQSEWIPITDGKQLDRDPTATKRPVGPPFEVKMFRSTRRRTPGNRRRQWRATKSCSRWGEMTGNIWMTRMP